MNSRKEYNGELTAGDFQLVQNGEFAVQHLVNCVNLAPAQRQAFLVQDEVESGQQGDIPVCGILDPLRRR